MVISHVLTLLMGYPGYPYIVLPSKQHLKEDLNLHYHFLKANLYAVLHLSLAVSLEC